MKILHQLGHNSKWNLDSTVENEVGEGFIYSAFNFDIEKLDGIDNSVSRVDLQFYGKNSSAGLGKLDTYPFHPANSHSNDNTITDNMVNIYRGIQYQEQLLLKEVIVPSYYEEEDVKKIVAVVDKANKYLLKKKQKGRDYYMTVVLSKAILKNQDSLDLLLSTLTDMAICFDGYYIVCESTTAYKRKINFDYTYLENLSRTFITLKNQGFKLIFGYANWDALIFLSLCDIDYITIGTYENLRNFNPDRFSHSIPGGPSDGWYFSEKLLNFIKAKEITNIRRLGGLPLIENSDNIFSDIILNPNFSWNTHKPDVHKNYLLAISRLLSKMAALKTTAERIKFILKLITQAQRTYEELANRKIYLEDESGDYFLGTWKSFLRSKQ